MFRTGLLIVSLVTVVTGARGADIPAWRGKEPGTAFLGPDRLWRCRDTLLFHMHNSQGDGFRLDIDVRDMNTYLQGPRAVLMFVTGPRGDILAQEILPDDGIETGNDAHHDGIPDMYGDLRYRAWHRHNSPGGTPPGRTRSPYLEHPETLEARTVSLMVPADGKGLYRLMIVGCWDHWISVTPDRPLATGVHPGPAPLYIHKDQLRDVWFHAPANVKDVGIAISEEVSPFGWSATLSDENGADVAQVTPKTCFNFATVSPAKKNALYRLQITAGNPGACLHSKGFPLLLCPDAQTARLLHGGLEIDAKGRPTYHTYQRTLLQWADALTAKDLDVSVAPASADTKLPIHGKYTLADVQKAAALQQTNPAADDFGNFATTTDKRLAHSNTCVKLLAEAAGWAASENPFYGNRALIRRVMLFMATQKVPAQNAFFWYQNTEGPHEFKIEERSFWGVPFRSNWYPLQDANFVSTANALRDAFPRVLPPDVFQAWQKTVRNWAIARTVAQQGECTNQWAKGLEHFANIWFATRDHVVGEALRYQIGYVTTPGVLGRVNPDPDYWCTKSKVGYGRAADSGIVGGGIPTEQFGHDGEYCLETVSHLSYLHKRMPDERLLSWLNEYYFLKTHLTLTKSGDWPPNSFAHTISPSDTNARTRYYTHKSGLHGAEKEVLYGDIWAGERNEDRPWPCLEKGSFVRSVDNRFHFIKTDAYYSILHTGPTNPDYTPWTQAIVKDGSVRWLGYGGMHYGGVGHKASKPGAISAVWAPKCGPIWAAQNHNVMYTNTVWGRRKDPVCEIWEEGHVDPRIVAECYSQVRAEWNPETRVLQRSADVWAAPLTVTRKVVFGDREISMEATVTANRDVELTELYECIPVYNQSRTATLYDGDLKPIAGYALPEAETTPSRPHEPQEPHLRGENPDIPRVSFRAIDVNAGDKQTGGALIILDQEYDALQTQPIRYRSVAAATGGMNLVLKKAWKKGERVTIRYRIVPHTEPLKPEDVKRIADSK